MLRQAIRDPSNYKPIIFCTMSMVAVGIIMAVFGLVLVLLDHIELGPPQYDSEWERYNGSSLPGIIATSRAASGDMRNKPLAPDQNPPCLHRHSRWLKAAGILDGLRNVKIQKMDAREQSGSRLNTRTNFAKTRPSISCKTSARAYEKNRPLKRPISFNPSVQLITKSRSYSRVDPRTGVHPIGCGCYSPSGGGGGGGGGGGV
ncbi:Hypothetical predicted protein [Olea europaea subsp. europaea]|uniref:Uncharacterized protein n=1 Tax=Olea europaea subsp. europaea TaxID=158383 RepID=A0A8S0TKW5_OLEEU|nr:Hypothetical predicted protein [Olea europaea subsp. europaea]